MTITAQDIAAAADEQRREAARTDLNLFAQYVDPAASKWYRAEHLRRISEEFMRVVRGEEKRLIINVQFRHWKSSMLSERGSAYWLGKRNKDAIIVGSYAVDLPLKFSKNIRDLITHSERYRALFPDTRIARGSEAMNDWKLETGFRSSFRAVGTGGGVSGYGAHLFLMDDVSDPNKAHSSTEYNNDWIWFKGVASTRLEPDGAIVVIGQRTAVDDLTGRLTNPELNDSAFPPHTWRHVVIPSENPDGTYIWEARFGRKYYESLKQDVTLWRVQCMQQPTVAEGAEIKRDWFEYVTQLPDKVTEQVRVIDTAWTDKTTADYFASIGAALHGGWLYLIEPYKLRMEMPDAVTWIENEKKLKPRVRFGMAKAAGEGIAKQFLTRLGIPYEDLAAERVKLRERLVPFVSFASRGLVKLVGDKAKWEAFMQEATAFPHNESTHDDLLACCAGITQMVGLSTQATSAKQAPLVELGVSRFRKPYG